MLLGAAGADRLFGAAGRDRLAGCAVADRRQSDTVRCGGGRRDVALVDRPDRVATDCERVRRR